MEPLVFPMSEKYEEFLVDESKYSGHAQSISFPENAEEICAIIKVMKEKETPITIQGGKTGITGGAVADQGHIMNLSKMNKVKDSTMLPDGTGRIVVEPGINLIDLRKEIASRFRKEKLFWPPDPTETSATVGGIAATNAQGVTRLLYGSGSQYIENITIIDANGNLTVLQRGEQCRRSLGDPVEALDMVIGKEGITGIIGELTLKLIKKPESVWGITFFFEDIESACMFVEQLKAEMPAKEQAKIAAVEFMDANTIELIQMRKPTMTKIKELPDVNDNVAALIYMELHGREEEIEEIAEVLMEMAVACNSNPEEAWAVSGESEIERMHAFRHGAAETANLFVEEARREDVSITKLGTDMSLSECTFTEVMNCIQKDLLEAELKGCVFGHALENHLHVNILSQNSRDYKKGIEVIQNWARKVEMKGGKVIGEHGIGKLKQVILGEFILTEYVDQCKELKQQMDPAFLFNQGNIFCV